MNNYMLKLQIEFKLYKYRLMEVGNYSYCYQIDIILCQMQIMRLI